MGNDKTVDMGPDSRTLAVYLSGAAQKDSDLYFMINASDIDRTFEIQEGKPGQWELVFDSGRASPEDFREPADRSCIESSTYVVGPRSIAGVIRAGA